MAIITKLRQLHENYFEYIKMLQLQEASPLNPHQAAPGTGCKQTLL